MLNLYIACCQKLYTQHCHFLYIVNLLITKTVRGRPPNRFYVPMVQSIAIVLLVITKLMKIIESPLSIKI